MKFTLKTFLSILILSFFSINLSAQTTAGEYMEVIGSNYQSINEDMMSYVSAAAHSRRAKKIEKKRKEVIGTMSEAIRKIKRLPDFNGDASYRDAVLTYLQTNFSMMNDDYAQIVNLEEVAEQSYDAMEAYILTKEKVDEKMNEAMLRLKEAQRVFAEANNINLVSTSSKLSEKMKQSNRVSKYDNQIYLVFFKSYKEESYLLEAISKGDLSAMEQRKNSLMKFSKEGLAKLNEIGAFDGDNTLSNSVANFLRFYQEECNLDVPQFQDFYLKKEKFEKIKAAIDSKKASERTQEDIDNYNNSVKDYNAGINTYNSVKNNSFNKRSKLTDAYNKAQNKFRSKHTPRYK